MSRKPCVALTRRSCVAALFLALAVAAPALAAPIDYIFTGVLTGSFYGGASGDQSVTIIATGDAAAVTAASTCNNLGSVRVAIPGKMATVTEPMAIFVDRPARNLGLRRGTCGAPLSPWLVVNNAVVFGSYSLAASLVPGPVVPTPSGLGSVSTTLGVLDVVANVLSSFEAQGPNPPPSGNAKLSGLALSSGLLTPAVNGNNVPVHGPRRRRRRLGHADADRGRSGRVDPGERRARGERQRVGPDRARVRREPGHHRGHRAGRVRHAELRRQRDPPGPQLPGTVVEHTRGVGIWVGHQFRPSRRHYLRLPGSPMSTAPVSHGG